MSEDLPQSPVDTLAADLDAAINSDVITRDDFKELFARSLEVLELSEAEACRMFKTARPTVQRWASGTSTPHFLGRAPVFRALLKELADRRAQRLIAISQSGLDGQLQRAIDQAERGETLPRPDKSLREYLERKLPDD